MLYYHYEFLLIFIILSIINFIFLCSTSKFKKISFIINTISLLFGIVLIIFINKDFISLISNEFINNPQEANSYFNIVIDFNITFFVTSLIITTILFLLSIKIKYRLLYVISIVLLIVVNIILFCFKGIIITKNVINLGMLAQCLIFYYLNLLTIPLIIKKYNY